MLSDADDALGHQAGNAEPGWFDRFWVNAHAVDGRTTISQGIGVYPNAGVVDGFAIVVRDGEQRIVRASSETAADPRAPRVGPIAAEMLEPLRRWRFLAASDDAGIEFEFEFEPAFEAIDCGTMREWSHFVQAGMARGRLRFDGEEIVIDPASWRAGRDRSWGRRPEGGAPFNWVCAQLPSLHLWYLAVDGRDGKQRFAHGWLRHAGKDGVEKIARLERRPEFGAEGEFRSAEVDVVTESGARHAFAFRRLPTTAFMRGGLYGGWRGHVQGERRGELVVESERWNVNDAATVAEVAGLNDHVVEMRSGDEVGHGIFELNHGR